MYLYFNQFREHALGWDTHMLTAHIFPFFFWLGERNLIHCLPYYYDWFKSARQVLYSICSAIINVSTVSGLNLQYVEL